MNLTYKPTMRLVWSDKITTFCPNGKVKLVYIVNITKLTQ